MAITVGYSNGTENSFKSFDDITAGQYLQQRLKEIGLA